MADIPPDAVVGWMRGDHLSRQYYCPPHVPRSQRTLGEKFKPVAAERAVRCKARCERCGQPLARAAAQGGEGDVA